MPALLFGLLSWAAAGLIPMVLLGAGLSLVTFVGLSPIIEGLMNQAVSSFSGLPSAAFQLALLAGVGQFFSIVGSAILSRIAIQAGLKVAGITFAN